MKRAADIGMQALALTEHGNISSHVRLEKAALEQGIKPIFGCELYAGYVDEERRTQRKNHLTVLAQSTTGYRNLMQMVSRGWAEGFYYEPTVSGAMLREHSEDIIVLSGCTASLLATSLTGGKNVAKEDASYERARRVASAFKDTLGDRYYLEVQCIPELDEVRHINQSYERLSRELDIPLVASADVHYVRPSDSEIRKILHGQRQGGKKSVEQIGQEWNYDIDASSPISDKNVYQRLRACGMSKAAARDAVLNTEVIASRCDMRLPRISPLEYPLPPGETPIGMYRKWLNRGWKVRGFHKLPRDEQRELIKRVEYESGLIESKGFVDYFLVLSDVVRWAKRQGIAVGPARGSAAASLVVYLLQISEVNPMQFPTLLFERFIDANRHDLPDVDLDFDDDRRHEIRDYLSAKYGEDRVGNIGTFTQYKGKNSLDDVARVYRIPEWEIKKVKDLLLERSSGDLRYGASIEDTVEMFPQAKEVFDKFPALKFAMQLESNMRGMSVHAAGLVVANEPLTNACAVYSREDKDGELHSVLSVDKYDAEYLNVLKIDVLGLKTMGLIGQAINEIGMTLDDLYTLPLDDQATLDGFRANDVVGIFQFDGRAMRSVNGGVVPDHFAEVCDVNALARPGPLHSGATAEYIDVKHGRKRAVHYHSIVDKITQHTQYQIVYQEQILQIVRELGKFSWEEAARIRKIISKKRGEQEFNSQRKKFLKGARTHGMATEDADAVWRLLTTAGAYAFNAAHSVSYGMLAWWTMWLKVHHPEAFFAAALRKYSGPSDKKKHEQLMRNAAKRDLPVLPPSPRRSGMTWQIEKRGKSAGLRAGFLQVPGIGEKTASAIVQAQEDGVIEGWGDLGYIRGIGPVTIEKIRSFAEDPDPFKLELLKRTIHDVKKEIASGSLGRIPKPTHTSVQVPYERGSDVEIVWLGVIRDKNYKDLFELHHSRTGEQLDPDTVKNPELVNWMVMTGEDDTDTITITVDRWKWPRFEKQVWDINIDEDLVLVHGRKPGFQARKVIYVTEMWVITPD